MAWSTTAPPHTPQPARLRLLLVGGVSFGVQVVEWVGLVASGFQFLLGLAAVFAEEVGGFGFVFYDGPI